MTQYRVCLRQDFFHHLEDARAMAQRLAAAGFEIEILVGHEVIESHSPKPGEVTVLVASPTEGD